MIIKHKITKKEVERMVDKLYKELAGYNVKPGANLNGEIIVKHILPKSEVYYTKTRLFTESGEEAFPGLDVSTLFKPIDSTKTKFRMANKQMVTDSIYKEAVLNLSKVKPKVILLASTNKGKVAEFQKIMAPMGYQVKSLVDYPGLPDVEETGETFKENALLKAREINRLTKVPVIADDSGLCVNALNGRPGVYSARYASDHDEHANNRKLLEEMRTKKNREATFVTVLALVGMGEEVIVRGKLDGLITHEERGTNGFGYDTVFEVNGRTLAEMSSAQKNKISHRTAAINELVNYLDLRY